jgi:esterase/lipase superfamily enzyme
VKRCGIAALAFAASIVVAGTAVPAGQTPPAARRAPAATIAVTIQGQVVAGQSPVAGAEVEVTGGSKPVRMTADEAGHFRLAVRVAPGTITVAARLRGLPVYRTIQVARGDAGKTFTVRLDLGEAEIRRREEERRQQEDRRARTKKSAPRSAPKPAPAPPPTAEAPPPPPPPPPPAPAPGGGAQSREVPPPAAATDVVTVPVFYATDRNRAGFTPLTYDGSRNADGQLHLGRFDVSVPKDHRLGQVERPTWRTFWREDANLHFIITARTELPYDEFYGGIRSHVAKSARREALIFIHGYNVAFEDAVYRTAQIAYDLEFAGAPILYSWPSEGRLASYPVDLNNNEWTTDHLRYFLQDVAEKSGAEVIHVIAHSMGNRALMNAMSGLVRERPALRKRFAEVMLTAPDIDADVFVRLASQVAQAARRVTLYASANDTALLASRTYQGYRRAGDASPEVVTCAEVDSIDVSALKTDFLGHSYVSDHRSVISDISELLRNGSPPERRFGLKPMGDPPRRYWLFRP